MTRRGGAGPERQGPAADPQPAMRADLTFSDADLEAEFVQLHAMRNLRLEKQFHFARALTWGAILLRVMPGGSDWQTAAILALGTVTTLAPAFLDRLPAHLYVRWRLPVQIADNVLQVALGCYTHSTIYPAPKGSDPSPFQMAAVLLTGNGVAWLLFCSLWGSVPFRYALPQQAALTIMLLLYSRPLCAGNAAIQRAYAALSASLARRARLLAGRLLALESYGQLSRYFTAGRSCAASVLAAPLQAREAVRAACMASEQALAQAGALGDGGDAAAGAPASTAAAAHERLCLRWQPLSLIALGFILPTLHIFLSELRMRRALLEQRRAAGAAGGAAAARARLPSPGTLPGLVEYALFAVPAVAGMWSFVVV